MSAELMATLVVPLGYGLLCILEWRWPARRFPRVEGWGRLGVAFFLMVAVTNTLTLLAWTSIGLEARALDLSALGWWSWPVGVVVISGLGYGWHRAAHHFDVLWRATHQLHHSAERVDIPGAFLSHPLEVVAKTTLSFLGGTVLLGLAPPVAAVASSTLTLLSLFQHANLATPRWLGALLPRPEMHALHHERGQHRRNYSDLPLWDLAFGTWVNPARFDGPVGLGFDVRENLGAMLAMRAVRSPRRSRGGGFERPSGPFRNVPPAQRGPKAH